NITAVNRSFTSIKLIKYLKPVSILFLLLVCLVGVNWSGASALVGVQGGPVLQGRIVNESDQPQAGATVSIWLEGMFVQSVLTLSDGQFTVGLPRPGQYNVTISFDGFRPQTEIVSINKDETLFRTFKLIPSSLHIVVLDALQEKLSDAIVTIKGEDGVLKRAIESPKGDYYFEIGRAHV